jgi:cell division septation protein DedD
MLETKELETSPVEKNSQPPEEVSKYHKRIDDLIEDAEIEAEIEAEKNIRSKNSRMFSISMIGIALIGFVYFQINQQSSSLPLEQEASLKKPETDDERLAKQVPVVEDGSTATNLPVPSSTISKTPVPKSNPFIKPPKSKNVTQPTKNKKAAKAAPTKKVTKTLKPKTNPIKAPSIAANKNSRFFIQAGAFGIKSNAELFLKKLKGKGFSPSIQTRSQKTNQHIVTVGNFTSKRAGANKLKELTNKGFKASNYKNPNNTISLNVGQFKNIKDAQKLQDRLSVKGFLSESHKANAPTMTYIVQLGVFPSREKALLTQEKLARAGYPKTFLR